MNSRISLRNQPGLCLVLIPVLILCACRFVTSRFELSQGISYEPLANDDGWQISTPAEQGLDPKSVSYAFRDAVRMENISSLLIAKNDYLVAEKYFNGNKIDHPNNIASVTKSFLSALFGIAVEQGYITDLDQKMMDYFPEYAVPGLDQDKYDITIRQLLQMRAGYPFDSTGAYYAELGSSGNYMRFIVEQHPLTNPPGAEWNYSSASAHILSGILTKAVGMPLANFAAKNLYDPLNIRIRYWAKDPQGYYLGGADMSYIPRDLAKFGVLYLNHGVFDGKQVVPSDWIDESLQAYSPTSYNNLGYFKKIEYGYLWWSAKVGKYQTYFAWGHGGQFIVIVPEIHMVVVTTAALTTTFGDEAWAKEKAIMDLLGRLIAKN